MSLTSAQVSTVSASSCSSEYGVGQGESPSASAASRSYECGVGQGESPSASASSRSYECGDGQGGSPSASAVSVSQDSSDSLDFDTVSGESPAMVPLDRPAARRVVRVSRSSVSSRLSGTRSWTTSSPTPVKAPSFPSVGWFVKGIWCPLPPKVELTFSSSGYMDRRAEHRRPIVPAVPSKGFPPGWTPHAHLSSGVRPIERQPAPSVHSWLMDRVHGDAPGFPGNPNRVFPFPPGSATDSTWSSGISDLPASQLGVPDNRNPWSDLFHSAVQSRAAHRRDMVPAVWSDLVRQVRMVRAARALEDVRRSTVFYNVFTKHIPRIRATRLLGRSRQAWPWLIHQTRMGRAADIGDQVLRQPLAEIWDYRPPSTRLPKCIDDAFATWDARESLDMAMPYEEVWKAKEHLDAAFDGWSAVGDVTVSLDFEAAFAGMDFGSLPDGSVQEQQQEMDDTDTLSSDDALDADSSVLSIPDPRSLTSLSERIAHWKKYGTAVERRVAAWQEAKGDALWRAPVLAPLPTDIPSPDEVSEADSSDLYEDDEDTPVFNDPLLEKVRLWQLSKGDALWRAPVLAPLPADIPSPPASDDASPEEADSEPSGDEEASEEDSFASAHSALLDRSSDSTDAPSPAAAACTLDTLLIPGSYPVGDSDNANAPSQSSGWCLPSWSSVGKACLGATALVFGLASGWLLSGSR